MMPGARALAAAIAFLLGAAASGLPRGEHPAHPGGRARGFPPACQYASYCDDTAFYLAAYADARRAEAPEAGPGKGTQAGVVIAGTISHHLFAATLIAGYFARLSALVQPATIILLGPNHRARGHAPIALSALPWRTPFGFVEPDTGWIDALARSGCASVEETPFINEHAIGALVPFIRRSFPRAMIVPVIFKKVASPAACLGLARTIALRAGGLRRGGALLLASLDFSHHRTSREAEREDEASLRVLRGLAAEGAGSAFVDSRPALMTLLAASRLEGASRVDVVQHTNSGIMARRPLAPCTSYINAWILKPEREGQERTGESGQ